MNYTGAAAVYHLYRDGKLLTTGTEAMCWRYIHGTTSFSVDHALKHEGFSMEPAAITATEHSARVAQHAGLLYAALVRLTDYALGNREVRSGNPYRRPSVRYALEALNQVQGRKDIYDVDTAAGRKETSE
jgi:hypothetical protein